MIFSSSVPVAGIPPSPEMKRKFSIRIHVSPFPYIMDAAMNICRQRQCQAEE
jgi:hypothetical protein